MTLTINELIRCFMFPIDRSVPLQHQTHQRVLEQLYARMQQEQRNRVRRIDKARLAQALDASAPLPGLGEKVCVVAAPVR